MIADGVGVMMVEFSKLVRRSLLPGMLMSMLVIGPALAQRNGDVSSGLNNQSTHGEVTNRESAAGVAPSPQRNAAQSGAVDNIYKDLMTKEDKDGLAAAPTDPRGPMTTAPLTTR